MLQSIGRMVVDGDDALSSMSQEGSAGIKAAGPFLVVGGHRPPGCLGAMTAPNVLHDKAVKKWVRGDSRAVYVRTPVVGRSGACGAWIGCRWLFRPAGSGVLVMSISSEQRVRQVLNLIWLTERCMQLPRTSHAERAQWAAEMERARRELSLIGPVPHLPDDLAQALVRAREPSPRAGAPGAPARSTFRTVAVKTDCAPRACPAGQ